MQKFFRSFALVTAIGLSLAPSLTAETMGTNPKPHVAVAQPTFLETVGLIVFAYLGF